MALDPLGAAALALHRFGFGPRPGKIAAIASDPKGALIAELDQANGGRVTAADLISSGATNRVAFEFNAERAAKERLAARRQELAKQEAVKLVAANAAQPSAAAENAGMEKAAEA